MPLQTGRNVEVSVVQETTFNVAPPQGGVGSPTPTMLRVNPTAGLRLARTTVDSREVRGDAQSTIPRMGSRSVAGSYAGELSSGTYDALLAAVVRGTWSGTTLTPAIPPVRRSFTFEQYERDIDISERFTGCRVTSMRVSIGTDGLAMIEFGVIGADMEIMTTATSPYMFMPSSTTRPAATTTPPLSAVNAAITIGGAAVLDLTSCEFTLELGGATQPVLGSQVSPDVFENNMRISGSFSAIRGDATRQAAFLAAIETGLVVTLAEPASTRSVRFELPRIVYTDYTKSLGDDNAMIATIPFVAGKPDASGMIIITSTL